MITVVHGEQPEPSASGGENFTGEVWRNTILPRKDGVAMGNVFFAPGARTHWHAHEGGQILIIVGGEGYVGDADGAVRVRTGDTVWTPPGVSHWHGASPDTYMIHTAVSIAGVEWFEAVPDEVYAASRT